METATSSQPVGYRKTMLLSQTGAVIYLDTDLTLRLSLELTETLFVTSDSEEHTMAVL